MICQNCHANIDNGLTFCTECGTPLQETARHSSTALTTDSVITKVSSANAGSSSNLKWIALIVALIVIPASLFGGYFLLKPNNAQPVQISNKQNSAVQTSNINTSTVNIPNSNSAANQNINNEPTELTEIMNERIEIAPNSNYARPFEIEEETAKINGKIMQLDGETIEGFVFFQEMYDEHSTDATYKVFSFDVAKNSEVSQTLIKGKYVLVFVNNTVKSTFIQGKFEVTK